MEEVISQGYYISRRDAFFVKRIPSFFITPYYILRELKIRCC
ncbi:hypothetical protein PREVCOP_06386 [Segatella copri DSM 18205]|uniref:Uncharacterized protein n=1 Tax=Segatella copri DSM 18205 TaxID=537011 RepID=D1PGM1_9BACT|nr:hypothetical protein PREVCOP_06386 [Segatella copri DSM 18205]